jgi:tetratricopeptide (TPR) repeat protein
MSAHSGINFWIGNSPTATGYPAMPKGMRASQEELFEDSISFAEKEAGRPLSRAEVSQHWNQKAKTWIRENPERWRQLLWTKFLNFWNAYQYDDLSIVSMLREFGVLPPGLRFGVVAALGIPGMLAALLWAPPRARFVIGAILLHMAALLPVFITERYRMCAVPGLLLCGAFGLCCLWQHLVNRKWMPAAVQCAFLSGAIWFVTLPRGDAAGWSLDDYNTAIRALDAERLDVAEKKLKIVYAYTPESAEVFFALGNLWLARGQRDRAKYQYRRALEIEPGHPEAWNNLGVLALEEKRHALAAQFLENAVRLEPNDAKTHYLLAKAYANLGQLAAAKRAIAEALSRRPNQQEFIDLGREIEAASAKQGGH